jgi:hypothetical protein
MGGNGYKGDLSTLNKIFLTLTPNSSSDVKISSTQTTNLYKNIKSTLQKNKEHLNIYKEYECIIKFIIMIDSYDMLKTKKKYLEYKGK